jgi:hypothetical protein
MRMSFIFGILASILATGASLKPQTSPEYIVAFSNAGLVLKETRRS